MSTAKGSPSILTRERGPRGLEEELLKLKLLVGRKETEQSLGVSSGP